LVGESAVLFPHKYWAAASQTMAGKVLVVGPEHANHNQAGLDSLRVASAALASGVMIS